MRTQGSLMGPDFIGVGAPRSGTSWIYEVLSRHSALWLPPVKELHYFDEPVKSKRHYRYLRMRLISGLWIKRPLSRFDLRYFTGKRSDAWYCSLFQSARARGLLTGEITPAYCTLDEAALCHMRMLNPKVQLIYIMRDPVMRSWSAVVKRRQTRGVPRIASEEEAIEYAKTEAVSKRSSYLASIERFERVFAQEQIFYGFYEQLAENPQDLVTNLLRFLRVDAADARRLLPPAPINVAAAGRQPAPGFVRALAETYLPSVEELCRRFEGPPHRWRARYEALLNDNAPAVQP